MKGTAKAQNLKELKDLRTICYVETFLGQRKFSVSRAKEKMQNCIFNILVEKASWSKWLFYADIYRK